MGDIGSHLDLTSGRGETSSKAHKWTDHSGSSRPRIAAGRSYWIVIFTGFTAIPLAVSCTVTLPFPASDAGSSALA